MWGQQGPGFICTCQRPSRSCVPGRGPGSSSLLLEQENTEPAMGKGGWGILGEKTPALCEGADLGKSTPVVALSSRVGRRGGRGEGLRPGAVGGTGQRNPEGSLAEEWIAGQNRMGRRRPWMPTQVRQARSAQGAPGTGGAVGSCGHRRPSACTEMTGLEVARSHFRTLEGRTRGGDEPGGSEPVAR